MSFLSRFFERGEVMQSVTPQVPASSSVSTGRGTFQVDGIFSLPGRGTVMTGKVVSGDIDVGFVAQKNGTEIRVEGIEMFNRKQQSIHAGDMAGLLIADTAKDVIQRGDIYEFIRPSSL